MVHRRALLGLSLLGLAACDGGPAPAETPEEAELVSEDVGRFWAAYDEGITGGDMEGALENGYRASATPQLAAFFARRIGGAPELAETVLRNRPYYESVRGETLAIAEGGAWWDSVRAAYSELERIEPDSVYPSLALVIGRMNSGGTTSGAGVLIGLELFTRQPNSPTETLTPFEVRSARGSQHLLPLIMHDLAHVQQERLGSLRSGDGRSLLERSLFEGIAELVAEELTGQVLGTAAATYGEAHEAELWAEFQSEMAGTDVSRWLYNDGADPERPGDLGYFIGYSIARTYAEASGDLEAGLRALLRATNAEAILNESGYGP